MLYNVSKICLHFVAGIQLAIPTSPVVASPQPQVQQPLKVQPTQTIKLTPVTPQVKAVSPHVTGQAVTVQVSQKIRNFANGILKKNVLFLLKQYYILFIAVLYGMCMCGYSLSGQIVAS